MIKFFKRRKKVDEKQLILVQILQSSQAIQRELVAMRGDSKSKGIELKLEVQKMSGELVNLTKIIYDIVDNLSKYFKIEVEFMEKEKAKKDRKPTEHDLRF